MVFLIKMPLRATIAHPNPRINMTSLHIQTPLLPSKIKSVHATSTQFWLKMEALQPCGSFKLRGVGYACMHHAKNGAQRFISSSGGNAGIAVAYAGKQLQIPVVVVVPETTSARARQLIGQEGAELIVHGESWAEANTLALSMVGPTDAFIHPFDDPLLWQGHASMIDEVLAQGVSPDAVVLSVGGGGLLAGVALGLERNNLSHIPIFALETTGAASYLDAKQKGYRSELSAITSIASSLGAKQVCQQAFDYLSSRTIYNLVVTDQQAVNACVQFLDDHRVVVEPACGAALAAVYNQLIVSPRAFEISSESKSLDLSPTSEACNYKNVLVIVCGGVTATVQQLLSWQQKTI